MKLCELIEAADHEVWLRISTYGDSSGVAYGTWNLFTADIFGGDERTNEILEDLNDREIDEFRLSIMRDPEDSNSWVPVLCVDIHM